MCRETVDINFNSFSVLVACLVPPLIFFRNNISCGVKANFFNGLSMKCNHSKDVGVLPLSSLAAEVN